MQISENLTPAVVDFLSAGTRTGHLSYLARDGRPLTAPVWFVIDDGALVFATGRDTSKGRLLAKDPRVAVSVDLQEPPYAFAQVQGIAEFVDDPDYLLTICTACGVRYMGAERGEEFGRRNAVPEEIVVRVRPTRVLFNGDVTA
ncbi:F420-dependent protein [Tsukamurella pulmonis]|uniref:PPOX class probable F420-dependent enzyme n=1 Tax=Tsukamurella pulmonis TaxID=47312 RepID=A0A1H1ELS6_9ACTN|nr:PPOX class F420-dependent oxidoreductase [Tsukamurella pulmonis]KXO91896.1 F420-dependent protein [Tsukamurella pulmonis]KXP09546.1 F420-dependent protein [Tsukamurella pulmonis]RDH09489.1 PPOX class F420-dependent oxidoreductase [Tsukamurella pulmonis]SDQ89498.1 PPOX class probable F420-dependent enzyme [Tsukamurella pulmonis]SUP20745.1 PPOX class probable F420-dependent enzyme [Tsukamurella pulmonis]